jgi:OmpA-OmpF porin, OOP family
LKVGVYGHTDNVGNDGSNQKLSEERANAVKSYLLSKGLPAQRIESKGFGSANPIADNSTAAGKAQNRRVQIVLGE